MKSPRNLADLPFADELQAVDGDLELEGYYDRVRFDGSSFADADAGGARSFCRCQITSRSAGSATRAVTGTDSVPTSMNASGWAIRL